MEKYFAILKNNIVESVILAGDDFMDTHIKSEYVDVTDRQRPSPGDSYSPELDKFISNDLKFIEFDTDPDQEHLQSGTDDSFPPMQLSKYSTSYADGVVTIGCKKLSAISLLDALHKILVDKEQNVGDFEASPEGPGHGKFGISWDDAKKLYDALSKVRL